MESILTQSYRPIEIIVV
ncbi:MAG: hypothetical protein V3W03_00745, partial [Gammaproteobacteria bacterium]